MRLNPFGRRAAVVGLVLFGVAACAGPQYPAAPNYVVFFTPFSADLDEPARGVIANAAAAARAAGSRSVRVEGYADPEGTPAANRTLTQLRTQVVADALVAQGVDRGRLVLRPRGSVGTDPGVESRRVEISVAAP